MLRLFLIHLLGVCLLLGQPSRAFVPEDWWNQIVNPCGRELAYQMIEVCGQVTLERFKKMRQQVKASTPSPVTTPSSVTGDSDNLNRIECTSNYPENPEVTTSNIQPSFQDTQKQYQLTMTEENSNPDFETFKKHVSNRQVEEIISSELKHSGMYTYFRKKRQISEKLSEDCCRIGCTRRSISIYC